MNIIYSDHAKKRMKQRGIEDREIDHILKHPSYTQKSFEDRRIIIGELKNRTIDNSDD